MITLSDGRFDWLVKATELLVVEQLLSANVRTVTFAESIHCHLNITTFTCCGRDCRAALQCVLFCHDCWPSPLRIVEGQNRREPMDCLNFIWRDTLLGLFLLNVFASVQLRPDYYSVCFEDQLKSSALWYQSELFPWCCSAWWMTRVSDWGLHISLVSSPPSASS